MIKIKIAGIMLLSAVSIAVFSGCSAPEANQTEATQTEATKTETVQTETVQAETASPEPIQTETEILFTPEDLAEVFPVDILPLPSGRLTVNSHYSEGIQGKKAYFAEAEVLSDLSPEVIVNYYEDKIGSFKGYKLTSGETDQWYISAWNGEYEVVVRIAPDEKGTVINFAVVIE